MQLFLKQIVFQCSAFRDVRFTVFLRKGKFSYRFTHTNEAVSSLIRNPERNSALKYS